jgi:hypothetical protein
MYQQKTNFFGLKFDNQESVFGAYDVLDVA